MRVDPSLLATIAGFTPGGYTAGPMVLAARTLGIPAALTEADAHLGLANRLAAPFARRVFLSYPLPGRTGEKYRVVGRPIPVAVGPRRAGDPPVLVASADRAAEILGWRPLQPSLEAMVRSAWAWRRAHREGFAD